MALLGIGAVCLKTLLGLLTLSFFFFFLRCLVSSIFMDL